MLLLMFNSIKYSVLLLACCLLSLESAAQQGFVVGYKIEQGDTVYQMQLREIVVFPRPTFKSEKMEREYQRLVYNFRKVYPYALTARQRLHEMDSVVALIPTEKQRAAYLKQKEKELFKEFAAPLKKLTYSQGRLLLRLIDREVGQTSYYLIKDLRGSFVAFFWQGIAKFFGADLKKPYDKYGEDKPIEDMIKMYHGGTFDLYYYQVFKN
jgi:hypothetical protein